MIRMIRISKKYYLRQIVACWLACYMLFGIPVQVAMASNPPLTVDTLPSGLHPGSIGVDAPVTVGNDMSINQTASEAIMNWDNFDIGSDASVTFNQLVTDAVLNRVHDGDVTGIMGTLNANGRVFVINPAGIVFGSGATINVPQLVASSLEILDEDFLNGLPYEFTENPDFIGADDGIVTNESSDFQNAKRLYLIGRQVINRGHLVADELVIMAAGDSVIISENSPVSVKVEMGDGWSSGDDLYQVRNEGGDGIEVDGDTAQVILAAGDIWSAALITASAGGSEAVATVDIDAAGDVIITDEVIAEAAGNGENETVATVTVNADGDLELTAIGGSTASIKAVAQNGITNTAEVLADVEGDVTLKATDRTFDKWSNPNMSTSSASIQATAGAVENFSEKSNAYVEVMADGDLSLKAVDGGEALIKANAIEGTENISEVLICADQVTVEALHGYEEEGGGDVWYGSVASIEAIAESGVGTAQNNTADVKIGAREGIEVMAAVKFYLLLKDGDLPVTASISAKATNGIENTAGVLLCANDDVRVKAEKDGIAKIKSEAGTKLANRTLQAYPSSSSDAKTTVISHDGVVLVSSLLGGANASIESVVYGGSTDTATTQVFATDVDVIGVDASIKVTNNGSVVEEKGNGYCMSVDGVVMEIGPDGTLIIDSSDCPDCPPCPCEEDDEDFFAPVAPLAQFQIPRVEGCPALTQAAAMELGITAETLQVAIGNALALNPSIQPCEACATLVNAANILRDEDGSRMAAMVQAFNTLAPANAPFTPEMATSIAMAFGGAAEGTQYASVMEYIDAFVQYVAVLDTELGSPVGDSVAFVMEKYGAGITGSNNGNITAFVATRLEAISK